MKKINKEKVFLAFKLSGFSYIIELENTIKILDYKLIKPNPYKHNFFLGEININEYYLPIFDLKTRLNIPGSHNGYVVIVTRLKIDNECIEVGITVDSLLPIITIPAHCITPCYTPGITNGSSYVNSIAKIKEDYYFILDTCNAFNNNDITLIKTLNDERLIAQQIPA